MERKFILNVSGRLILASDFSCFGAGVKRFFPPPQAGLNACPIGYIMTPLGYLANSPGKYESHSMSLYHGCPLVVSIICSRPPHYTPFQRALSAPPRACWATLDRSFYSLANSGNQCKIPEPTVNRPAATPISLPTHKL